MNQAVPCADSPATRLATRLAFFVSGFGMACWAPLVPYAKARLGIEEAVLGLLLLCLGAGSMLSMPLAGGLAGRIGSRPVILAGGIGLCCAMPLLAVADSGALLAFALALFGASLGAMDVAMSVHAVEVTRDAPVPLMSGFHGMFSVGGFAGSLGMTALLAAGLAPLPAILVAVAIVVLGLVLAAPRLLRTRSGGGGAFFVLPRGIVLLLGALAFAMFLAEGAMLDWGAILLVEERGFDPARAGLGYALFSLAMLVGRLSGDKLIARLGERRILVGGGLLATAGFALLLLAPHPLLALPGFPLVGLGAANVVPVLFTAAGRQTTMPANLAVAALTTVGYAGVLAGPALVGFVAQGLGLVTAFMILGALMLSAPLTAGRFAR
ncbi:MFS transporter [Pseudomonas tohonis]|uniref:MFS transporter n=1 Tax=Pseudomonas tohonis TaxID=2725477 RepID=UPI001F1E2965|nr:MFS transporter [Pseudomonas tohonis]